MALFNGTHLLRATKHSIAGLRCAWRQEQAFRLEVLLIPVVMCLLVLLRPGFLWSALLLCGWMLVIAIELLNSAIETAFDLITPEYNLYVKYGKDMASAAIFAALCGNGVLWVAMLCDIFI